MVEDDLIDMRESFLPMWIQGLRCVACGNIVDAVIARNRSRQLAGAGPALDANAHTRSAPRQMKAA